MNIVETDVLIIGGGIAGLMAAEYLSSHKNVIIITKSNIEHSNSYMAQGGISAAIHGEDHWKNHLHDTIHAGHLHNNQAMTEHLVKEGQNVINTLSEWGVPFDKASDGSLLLGKEGGHHCNRIVHAGGDQTGKKVMEVLIDRVKKKATLVSGQYAIDLIVEEDCCIGAFCKDENENLTKYHAVHTILAGGGYAGIYSASSNAHGSDGSSICMAYRADVELTDLEFVQFHPTLLRDSKYKGLITEAVRGQGGILVNSMGTPVMEGYHPMKDLAPRDIVSRRLFQEIHVNGESVYIDIRGIDQFEFKFPGVTTLCKEAGISIKEGLIPVSPGAHFTMGGIMTDFHAKTSLEGLYAVGECACTGVHGANRLASNSLLEGAVFAKQAANDIISSQRKRNSYRTTSLNWYSEHTNMNEELLDSSFVKTVMDESAGICRNHERLSNAKDVLKVTNFKPSLILKSVPEIQKLNIQTMAWLTVTSCLKRTESRGSHYRTDYPVLDKNWNQKNIVRCLEQDESNRSKKAVTGFFN